MSDGRLRLRLIGPFRIDRRGGARDAQGVGSRQARTVLALLAVRPGWVDLDPLAAAVWPGGPPRAPAANLATLVSRLRATLGREAVAGERGCYRLGARVGTDLDDAEALVAVAPADPTAARRALNLLGEGPVLADWPDAKWAVPARARQAELLRQARTATITAAIRAGDVWVARRTAETAVAADPLDEAAFRLLMRSYLAAGEPARALRAYQRLRTTLTRELGVDPAPETARLHVAILRNVA